MCCSDVKFQLCLFSIIYILVGQRGPIAQPRRESHNLRYQESGVCKPSWDRDAVLSTLHAATTH